MTQNPLKSTESFCLIPWVLYRALKGEIVLTYICIYLLLTVFWHERSRGVKVGKGLCSQLCWRFCLKRGCFFSARLAEQGNTISVPIMAAVFSQSQKTFLYTEPCQILWSVLFFIITVATMNKSINAFINLSPRCMCCPGVHPRRGSQQLTLKTS